MQTVDFKGLTLGDHYINSLYIVVKCIKMEGGWSWWGYRKTTPRVFSLFFPLKRHYLLKMP